MRLAYQISPTIASSSTTSQHYDQDRGMPNQLPPPPIQEALESLFAEETQKIREQGKEVNVVGSLRLMFERVDRNGDGMVNRRELILALRKDAALCTRLNLPSYIHQEDGSRESFERLFQDGDRDDDRQLSWEEFMAMCDREQRDQRSSEFTSSVDTEEMSRSLEAISDYQVLHTQLARLHETLDVERDSYREASSAKDSLIKALQTDRESIAYDYAAQIEQAAEQRGLFRMKVQTFARMMEAALKTKESEFRKYLRYTMDQKDIVHAANLEAALQDLESENSSLRETLHHEREQRALQVASLRAQLHEKRSRLEEAPQAAAVDKEKALGDLRAKIKAEFQQAERARQQEYKALVDQALAAKEKQCNLALHAAKREQQKDRRVARDATKALKVHEMVAKIQREKAKKKAAGGEVGTRSCIASLPMCRAPPSPLHMGSAAAGVRAAQRLGRRAQDRPVVVDGHHPVLPPNAHDNCVTQCGKEYVVVFSKGPLGLQFEVKRGGGSILVKQVVSASQAAEVCLINLGDELVGVNSASVVGKDFHSAMAVLRRVATHTDDGLRLHFHPDSERERKLHEAAIDHPVAAASEVF
jgi:hypothetical protein